MGNRQARVGQGAGGGGEGDGTGGRKTGDDSDAGRSDAAVIEVDQFDQDGKIVEQPGGNGRATSAERAEAGGATGVTSADVTPADVTPADVRPADVTPADVIPADVTPASGEERDCEGTNDNGTGGEGDDQGSDAKREIGEDFGVSFDCADFAFENLVLAGDRVRSVAHCGAVQVLEEAEVWKRVKRISGCSAGALAAALLCVGYTGRDIQRFLLEDTPISFQDRRWVDKIKPQSWNYGNALYDWLGGKIKEKAGDQDATFLQVHEKCGRELCIVVTNMSHVTTEYFHPKTTPDVSVRLAVRMSMALPGRMHRNDKAIFRPVALTRANNKERCIYIDGSLLDHRKLQSFDGWWLSMTHDDGILLRMPEVSNPDDGFDTYSNKTIGLVMYDDLQCGASKNIFEQRTSKLTVNEIPDTTTSRRTKQSSDLYRELSDEYSTFVKTSQRFIEAVRGAESNTVDSVSSEQLESIFSKEGGLSGDDLKTLFPGRSSVDGAMQLLVSGTGKRRNTRDPPCNKVRYSDVTGYLNRQAYDLQRRWQAAQIRTKPKGSEVLYRAAVCNVDDLSTQDIERCIGVNTRYIGRDDVDLEKDDVLFLIKQGRRATIAFLSFYGLKYLPDFDPHPPRPFEREELMKFIEDDLSEIIDLEDYDEKRIENRIADR